ncbi:MAG TPA: metallophosphoesterase [Acidimicrobiales bacterium]|nr:metallophosphoesterase [Acidimicrobiales bacterium]
MAVLGAVVVGADPAPSGPALGHPVTLPGSGLARGGGEADADRARDPAALASVWDASALGAAPAASPGLDAGVPWPEVTTVADDEVVLHVPAGPTAPARTVALGGLSAGALVDLEAALGPAGPAVLAHGEPPVREVRTLPRPPGARLATVVTVNDLHFGETECGAYDGPTPIRGIRVAPGEAPYPETMNRAAVAEIGPLAPAAVVAKGDLTDAGRPEEVRAFLACWGEAFGERLHWVGGNHDVTAPGREVVGPEMAEVQVPGLTLALLDTTIPGRAGGRLSPEQLAWLDEVTGRADRPVLVLGHHHPWDPGSRTRPEDYFGIRPGDSEALVALVANRPAVIGYAAGHTHRNRVRRFAATGDLPWIEVASLKDFPGSWVEYRVFEGGVLQVHRRVSTPPALAWSERCRAILDGWYPTYAFGSLDDRCFPIWPRG